MHLKERIHSGRQMVKGQRFNGESTSTTQADSH